MNREKSVLQTRLHEDTLDHIMCINIDGLSLDNFDTENFISDWIESAVTSIHLNGHNSSRTETHEKLTKMLLLYKGKTKQKYFKIILFVFIFFLTWMMWSYLLALVDMNYLIVIIVNNTIEANYRIML